MFTVGLEESGRKEINTNQPLYNIAIYTRRRIFVHTTLFLITTLKRPELVSALFSLYFTEEKTDYILDILGICDCIHYT